MIPIRLSSPHARLEVSPVAAMIADAEFVVGGRRVRPLARAPWYGDAAFADQPGHLRELGGDFVAVPFGSVGAPEALDPAWCGIVPADAPERPHGRGADEVWTVVEQHEDRVTLALEHPEDDPIRRLVRRIALRQGAAAVDLELELHVRRPVELPVGLHPILALPQHRGALDLAVPFAEGHTYPGRVWPGRGVTRPAAMFHDLAAVPGPGAHDADLSRLPLPAPVEDVVLLAGVAGPVVARNAELEAAITLDWDRSVLPSVMLWISDRVLQEEPWLGRYRGLGVEPIAAAFDFGVEASTAANPLRDRGIPTTVALDQATPTIIRSSIAVAGLDA